MIKELLLIILFIFCFLYILNLFLNGAWKRKLEFLFGLLIVATITASFVTGGFGTGAAFIVFAWLFVAISEPFAKKLAHIIMGRVIESRHTWDDIVNETSNISNVNDFYTYFKNLFSIKTGIWLIYFGFFIPILLHPLATVKPSDFNLMLGLSSRGSTYTPSIYDKELVLVNSDKEDEAGAAERVSISFKYVILSGICLVFSGAGLCLHSTMNKKGLS